MIAVTGHPRNMVIERGSDESAITTVRESLNVGEPVSATDVAWRTKLPVDACRAALFELCARHPSRMLAVGEHGLLFSFEDLSATRPRLRPTSRWERALAISLVVIGPELLLLMTLQIAALIELASHWPTVPQILTIAIALPVAFVLFVVGFLGCISMQFFALLGLWLMGLAIALPIVPLFQEGDAAGRVILALFLGGLGAVLCFMPGLRLLRSAISTARQALEGGAADWIWRSLHGMVRGPVAPSAAVERDRVLALIAHRGGTFGDEHLMELEGWSQERAGVEAAQLVLEHGGELVIFSLVLAVTGLALVPGLQVLPLHLFGNRPAEGLGAWPYLPLLVGIPARVVTWLIQRRS